MVTITRKWTAAPTSSSLLPQMDILHPLTSPALPEQESGRQYRKVVKNIDSGVNWVLLALGSKRRSILSLIGPRPGDTILPLPQKKKKKEYRLQSPTALCPKTASVYDCLMVWLGKLIKISVPQFLLLKIRKNNKTYVTELLRGLVTKLIHTKSLAPCLAKRQALSKHSYYYELSAVEHSS